MSRGLGLPDSYPFVLSAPAIGKLRFIHDTINDAPRRPLEPARGACYTLEHPRRRSSVSIHVALNHVMHYRYDRPVTLGPQIIRLRPAPHCRTRILSYSLKIEPAEHFINWQQDPQSNYLARVVFPKPARELRIEVDLIAEMAVLNPVRFLPRDRTRSRFPFKYEPTEQRELTPFLVKAPATPLVAEVSRRASRASRAPRSISWWN